MSKASKITQGIMKAFQRSSHGKKVCTSCGFKIPIYPGRYHTKCPECEGTEFKDALSHSSQVVSASWQIPESHLIKKLKESGDVMTFFFQQGELFNVLRDKFVLQWMREGRVSVDRNNSSLNYYSDDREVMEYVTKQFELRETISSSLLNRIIEKVTILKPVEVDDEYDQKFNEFVQLKSEMNSMARDLKALEAKYKALQGELIPIVKEAQKQEVKVDNVLIRYKRRKTTSVSYKTLFNEALEHVNDHFRGLLNDMKDKLTKRGEVESLALELTKPDEGVLSRIMARLKAIFASFWSSIRGLQDAVSDLERLGRSL